MDFYDAETGIVTIGRDIDKNTNIFYFTDLVNGVNEKSIVSEINIYPKPTSNTLNINGIIKNINYSIFNLQGQSILKGNTNNNIDVSTLPQGMYILNLETESGVLVNKFIKE